MMRPTHGQTRGAKCLTIRTKRHKAEITYQISRRDKAQYYLRQMEAMAEGRLGRHGHLERKRETEEDDNYQRDLGLLMTLDDQFLGTRPGIYGSTVSSTPSSKAIHA